LETQTTPHELVLLRHPRRMGMRHNLGWMHRATNSGSDTDCRVGT